MLTIPIAFQGFNVEVSALASLSCEGHAVIFYLTLSNNSDFTTLPSGLCSFKLISGAETLKRVPLFLESLPVH